MLSPVSTPPPSPTSPTVFFSDDLKAGQRKTMKGIHKAATLILPQITMKKALSWNENALSVVPESSSVEKATLREAQES